MKGSTFLSAASVSALVAGFALEVAAQGLTCATGDTTCSSIILDPSAQWTTYVGMEPGKAAATRTIDVTARIVSIDATTRDITLKGPKGNYVVVTAGPEVKNFDQLKLGDQVQVQFTATLFLQLIHGASMAVTRSEQAGTMGAMPGAQPGGVAGRRITVVADVVAVDREKQTVTLQGPQHRVEVKVANPDQFRRIKQGDQVYASYTQALAMKVEPKK